MLMLISPLRILTFNRLHLDFKSTKVMVVDSLLINFVVLGCILCLLGGLNTQFLRLIFPFYILQGIEIIVPGLSLMGFGFSLIRQFLMLNNQEESCNYTLFQSVIVGLKIISLIVLFGISFSFFLSTSFSFLKCLGGLLSLINIPNLTGPLWFITLITLGITMAPIAFSLPCFLVTYVFRIYDTKNTGTQLLLFILGMISLLYGIFVLGNYISFVHQYGYSAPMRCI